LHYAWWPAFHPLDKQCNYLKNGHLNRPSTIVGGPKAPFTLHMVLYVDAFCTHAGGHKVTYVDAGHCKC